MALKKDYPARGNGMYTDKEVREASGKPAVEDTWTKQVRQALPAPVLTQCCEDKRPRFLPRLRVSTLILSKWLL